MWLYWMHNSWNVIKWQLTDKLAVIPDVSNLINTFSTRFYCKLSYEILSSFTVHQSIKCSYWCFTNNLEFFITLRISKLAKIKLKNHVITERRRPFWNSLLMTHWCMNYLSLVDYLCTACVWLYTSRFSGKKYHNDDVKGLKKSCIKYDTLSFNLWLAESDICDRQEEPNIFNVLSLQHFDGSHLQEIPK